MVTLDFQATVADGVYRCGSQRVNWYLVESQDEVTVVDTGFPSHYDLLISSLESLGLDTSDVVACILTHAHPDHIGFAQRLREEHEVPLWIHEAGIQRARAGGDPPMGGMIRNLWRPAVFRYFIEVVRSNGTSIPPVTSVETFTDDEKLAVPGRPRVIHLPGHTEDQVAFHLPDRDVLLSGDALATVNFETWEGNTPQLLPAWLNHDHAKAQTSIAKLEPLDDVLLLPGHGDPWEGDMAVVAQIE